jgi:hypothetical protein
MSEKEEKGRTLLIERHKYGVRFFDPFDSHYSFSFYIKESDDGRGWCEILVEEDGKTSKIIEYKCVIKNRDHDELMPPLQEVLEHILQNYGNLKIASFVSAADKLFDP